MSKQRSRSKREVESGEERAHKPTVLVTGAAGGLADVTVHMLSKKYRLVGVDPRALRPGQRFPGRLYRIDYRKRRMADVFREHQFDALLHLGRVPVTSRARQSTRYNLNVLGTRSLLELALKHSVRNVVVCSTFHVYGAHQHNHLGITSDDPLRASQTFPELADAVELDNISTIFLLKHPELRMVVLRPVNVIGPRIQNQISKLLRQTYVPMLLGYDPLQQFIHEKDLARALMLALVSERSGLYNVAGEGSVSYSRAIELAGGIPVPVPHFLMYPTVAALQRFGSNFPMHLLDYFRYPTILSDVAFRRDFGFEPKVTTAEALRSLRS